MIRVSYVDKPLILEILCEAFEDNRSVNYVVGQNKHRKDRIQNLMDYSFEVCYRFGAVYLSEDRSGCMLILYPDTKKTTLKTIGLDLKLAIRCIGLFRIAKVLERQSKIKAHHPRTGVYYIWFIGVKSSVQKKGIGSSLINFALQESKRQNKDIYLETSTLANVPWYQKFGFYQPCY